MRQNRLYTEQEFGSVLRRATELQQEDGAASAHGLTLSELQHVAREAGIDPEYVRRAAIELNQQQPEKGDQLFGGPTKLDILRVVDGEINAQKWDEALESIRHIVGADGREVLDGPSREWLHRDQMGGRLRVTMTPSEQQTRLRVSYGMTEWLWLHFIMVCVGIGPVAVQYALLDLGAITETGIALFILMAFYMIGWLTFRIFSGRQDRKLQQLAARLDEIVADHERHREPIEDLATDQARSPGTRMTANWADMPASQESRRTKRMRSS